MKKINVSDYLSYEGQVVKVVSMQTPVEKVFWLRPVNTDGPDIMVIDTPEFQEKVKPLKTITEE
jgi:hypothetical protein